ncbi:germin-like protein 9-3 [Aristolochia californica]|uniref:germin-like protein 9-3 n=1 Tax=Aristolochia californica TaxID=171875 RepID=UPI0035E13649
MALSVLKHTFLFLVATLATAHFAEASDPDIISDFLIPPNVTGIDGNFFTFTGYRVLNSGEPPKTFAVVKATKTEFPALDGQSVSYAALTFPAGSINPPHTHPRSAELLFLVYGSLDVGFVDTTGKLYAQTLQAGDMFVFPKGLVHYQLNSDAKNPALALSAFGSASAGTVSIPNTLFLSGIDDNVLAMSFKTDVATIQKLKAGLAPKA